MKETLSFDKYGFNTAKTVIAVFTNSTVIAWLPDTVHPVCAHLQQETHQTWNNFKLSGKN